MMEVKTITSLSFRTALKQKRYSSVLPSEKVRACRQRGLTHAAQVLSKAQFGASNAEICADGLFQEARCEVIDYRISQRGLNSDEVAFADQVEVWLKEARASA